MLVVDDDEDIRDALAELLASEGYVVDSAYDGVDALEKLDRALPDVVLLDVMMPRIDGLEVHRRLRADERWRAVRVILMTASSRVGLGPGLEETTILTKPIDLDGLLTMLGPARTA